jgi:hypothetical protein
MVERSRCDIIEVLLLAGVEGRAELARPHVARDRNDDALATLRCQESAGLGLVFEVLGGASRGLGRVGVIFVDGLAPPQLLVGAERMMSGLAASCSGVGLTTMFSAILSG